MPIERVQFLNVSDVMSQPHAEIQHKLAERVAACELYYAMAEYALEGWKKAERFGHGVWASNPPPHTMIDLAREVQANNS